MAAAAIIPPKIAVSVFDDGQKKSFLFLFVIEADETKGSTFSGKGRSIRDKAYDNSYNRKECTTQPMSRP